MKKFAGKYQLILLAGLIFFSCEKEKTAEVKRKPEEPKVTVKIKRVIDGDTFEIETGERVRVLGIDTPEKYNSEKLTRDSEGSKKDIATIKKLGELSSQYAEKMLKDKRVILKPDSTNSDKDKYGRLLRYVYLEDGTFFNKKIIEEGYAYAYTRFPLIYLEDFRRAEREARENKKGLWGDINFTEMDTN